MTIEIAASVVRASAGQPRIPQAPSTQNGTAQRSTMPARRQSTCLMNADMRLAFENIAEMAIIGTNGSGPTSGTSTSGIRAPVPWPDTPPTSDRNRDEQKLGERDLVKAGEKIHSTVMPDLVPDIQAGARMTVANPPSAAGAW
jgi:hypothetical protein